MREIGFIGNYDKTDLIIYVARVLVGIGKRVIVIDSTINQKAKYVVPVIRPTISYVTEFEGIDVAVGFKDMDGIKQYLGTPSTEDLNYDIALLDIDSYEGVESFNIAQAEKNYFVTSFDVFSLKKGLESLGGLTQIVRLTKVLYSDDVSKEEDDYLNYLSLGYKIEWENERIYFPYEVGDRGVIAENQRVSKIKFKKLSEQYKESLKYIVEQLAEEKNYSDIKRIFKQLEKGV